jgi:hypothetical protein
LRALLVSLSAADVVQGRTLPDPAQSDRWGPFSRSITAVEEGLYPTCNVAYHQSLLRGLGGFDGRYRRSCDDTDLAWRARESGASTTFAHDALVYHEVTASSFWALLRSLPRWDDVPLALKTHPELRRILHHGVFWKRPHAPALVGLAGLALIGSRSTLAGAVGIALVGSYANFRVRRMPLPRTRRRRRIVLLPATFVLDLVEVAVMIKGSARHRGFVL